MSPTLRGSPPRRPRVTSAWCWSPRRHEHVRVGVGEVVAGCDDALPGVGLVVAAGSAGAGGGGGSRRRRLGCPAGVAGRARVDESGGGGAEGFVGRGGARTRPGGG